MSGFESPPICTLCGGRWAIGSLNTIKLIMRRHFLLICVMLGTLLRTASAETWPNLSEYVEDCILIVKAQQVGAFPEVENGDLTFKVLETWKGLFDPHDLSCTTPDGFIIASQGEHGVKVARGQKIIFFFTRRNQPTNKISGHSTAFPIASGRITYASTSWDLRREYTVKEFHAAINSIVDTK